MRIQQSLNSAFTLVEIMIVVAIIGLLAAIAIPNFLKAQNEAKRTACTANLQTINGAKITWALEARKGNSDIPADGDLFGQTLYIPTKPTCPANGAYLINQVDTKPACSVANHTF